MNKKKLVLVVLIGFLVVNLFVYKLIKVEPQKYVLQNQDEITKKCEKLLVVSGERTHVYDEKSEIPKEVDFSEQYLRLRINMIASEKKILKYGEGYEDYVKIFLKNSPNEKEYLDCGIYYSPNNCTIDYYGHAVEEDENGIFVYDGEPKGMRIKYKSERICDNWFYFQESVWN